TVQNIVSVAIALRNMGKDVFVCPVPTRADLELLPENLVEDNMRRNEILETYLRDNKMGIKAGPWIDGRSFEFKHESFYYKDGVHFNKKGYDKIAKDFADMVVNCLVKKEFETVKDLLT
ncbi:hypothetical protein HK405_010171, partial [Cladochytrium tenue]